jgi:hypothetical protein
MKRFNKREYSRRHYAANKEKRKRQARLWAQNNRDKVRAIGIRSRCKHKEKRAAARMKKRYGIEPKQYFEILKSQFNLCPICKRDLRIHRRHVDHCHERKIVRGILCGQCNQGIGLLQHSPEVMLNAIKYLSK